MKPRLLLTTVGLVLVSPVVAERLWWLPERFGLREIVSATLSTQLAVLPLLLYQVGQVSLIAPVVNVLVLPPIPYVMGIGFTAGLVGMLASTLALPLAWAAHLILSYVFLVTDVAGRLPFASVMLPPIAWWVVALLYGALAYGYVRVTRTARLASSGRR